MNPTIIKLRKEIANRTDKIHNIQLNCEHLNCDAKYGANTGNYDPSSDNYWLEVTCSDCGQYMRFDSDKDKVNYLKYGKHGKRN